MPPEESPPEEPEPLVVPTVTVIREEEAFEETALRCHEDEPMADGLINGLQWWMINGLIELICSFECLVEMMMNDSS